MTVDDFKSLPDSEQLRIIFHKAKFVDSLEKEDTVFALYFMRTFFIELEYNTSTFRLSAKRTFENDQRLNKYLDWSTTT